MTPKEKYNIYNEMFKQCAGLEKEISKAIESMNGKVYSVEVYVGREETREFQIYIECVMKLSGYRNIRGLYTLEELKKAFHFN